MGGRDFRGAFVGRRTRQGLLQGRLALSLAKLHLPLEDILQKLPRPLTRLPFRRFGSGSILLAFLWWAGIRHDDPFQVSFGRAQTKDVPALCHDPANIRLGVRAAPALSLFARRL